MRLLIVNADDFGLSRGVNEGIIEGHRNGIVTSASLMVNRPGAEHASELARDCPDLGIGLHFEETAGCDLDNARSAEWHFAHQLDRFRSLCGKDPSHVDSHHHVHVTPERLPTFRRLVAPLRVPLRRDGQIAYIGGFYAHPEPDTTRLELVGRRNLLALIKAQAGEGFTELGCHPARVTGDFSSSYLSERAVELATLTSPALREEVEATGVKLVSFATWPG